MSKARARWGVNVFQKLFDRIVSQCTQVGLVDGTKLFMDSGNIQADTSNNSVVNRHDIRSWKKEEKLMSIESVKAYIERLKTDEEFQERVKAAADKEARAALVKAEGFDFSEEDVKEVTKQLSDTELEQIVAGGWCYDDPLCLYLQR